MQSTAVELVVRTVDGECMPVPGLEIGVRYHYTDAPNAWSLAVTDGNGIARFDDAHPSPPLEIDVYTGDVHQGTFDVTERRDVVLEL